jgi:hypothetical protein
METPKCDPIRNKYFHRWRYTGTDVEWGLSIRTRVSSSTLGISQSRKVLAQTTLRGGVYLTVNIGNKATKAGQRDQSHDMTVADVTHSHTRRRFSTGRYDCRHRG